MCLKCAIPHRKLAGRADAGSPACPSERSRPHVRPVPCQRGPGPGRVSEGEADQGLRSQILQEKPDPTPRPPSSVTCTPRSGPSPPFRCRLPLTRSCIGRAWGQVYFELVSFRGLPERASTILRPQLTLVTLSCSLTRRWPLEVGTSIYPPAPHTEEPEATKGPTPAYRDNQPQLTSLRNGRVPTNAQAWLPVPMP